MNSLIQQLYLVEGFRRGVFSTSSNVPLPKSQEIEVAAEGPVAKKLDGVSKSESLSPRVEESKLIETKAPNDTDILFNELQLMFAHLQNGATRYYDTLPFCRSFKDYDGRPVNLGDQKDVVRQTLSYRIQVTDTRMSSRHNSLTNWRATWRQC